MIKLFTKDGCPSCDELKNILKNYNIEFSEEKNIKIMKELGIKSVPVLNIDNKLYNYEEIIENLENIVNSNIDGRELMSNAKFYEAYSRYLDNEGRYETWQEAVNRVMNMHRFYYKDKLTVELESLINEVEVGYSDKLFLGAQRGLQFGGDQLLKHNSRLYNCSASFVDRPNFFGGMFYLLLSGAGVGFSVQKQHICKLPKIQKRKNIIKTYIVEDSIEGWASTIDVLLSSYFEDGGVYPEYKNKKVYFDLSKIRPKGSYINGGFKAPGGEPLRKALDLVENLIEKELLKDINVIRPIVAYDISMYIADAVISGGVRRSATICMFSKDDEDMIKAKTGNWYTENPQRGRSNNSVMLLRDDTSFEEFNEIMKSVQHSGEPGFIWTSNLDFAYNPCVEVGMLPLTSDGRGGFQMCNLTEINGAKSVSKEIFFIQCKLASILGTLQAGYTNFKFMKDATEEIVKKEALIGVGITGITNNPEILLDENILKKGAEIVKFWNKKIAHIIGINQASRTTVVKPSGNSSVLLKSASGIHGEHSKNYIRHVQFNKDSEIAQLFLNKNSIMCEDSVWNRERDIVVGFPIKTNGKSLYKNELLGIKQLELVKKYQNTWIEYGTNIELCVDKNLRHNVSNTITVDNWDIVSKYIYENRDYLCGVSLLSSVGDKAYPQAPFTEVLTYNDIVNKYGEISLFTSALIEVGLNAFNNDLWTALNTCLGFGEKLNNEKHEHLLKRDFVRRFNKFSKNFISKEECSNCLKDVFILHKWWRINRDIKNINWKNSLSEKTFTDINTIGAQGCSGGKCDVE
jgi:ribonucleoside-triphosphate reductase